MGSHRRTKPGLPPPAPLPLDRPRARRVVGGRRGAPGPALARPAVDLRRAASAAGAGRSARAMKQALLTILRCAVCGGAIEPDEFREELEEGTLRCLSCGETYLVERG